MKRPTRFFREIALVGAPILLLAAILPISKIRTEKLRAVATQDLREAVENNDNFALSEALRRGANPNAKIGKTPVLLVAADYGDKTAISALQKAGATLDKNGELLVACALNQLPRVQILVKSGADINGRDAQGDTPLCYAAALDYAPLTQWLLKNGADPNLKSKENRRPLDWAREYNCNASAALLKPVTRAKK